jgi:hypothetical protein
VSNPFGSPVLSSEQPTASIAYSDQAMLASGSLIYLVTSDNHIQSWDPITNVTQDLGVYNEFPQSAQWWGLWVPGTAGVVNGDVVFEVAQYGGNGPGVTYFALRLPVGS